MTRTSPSLRLAPAALLLGLAGSLPAAAQSSDASQASAYSIAPSVEVAAAVLSLVPAGSALVVQALRPVGQMVELVLVSAATGASFTLQVSAELVQATALVAGASLVVTVVAGGYLLSTGAGLLAFIPDALTHSLIHHAELHR